MVRVLSDFSQPRLADRVGISYQQLQKYENGKNRVSASMLYELGKVLGVPAGRFFEGCPGNVSTAGDVPQLLADDRINFIASAEGRRLVEGLMQLRPAVRTTPFLTDRNDDKGDGWSRWRKSPMTGQSIASASIFKAGNCRTTIRDSRTWGRVQADHVRRAGLEKEETSFTSHNHLVLLNLKGNSERGEYFLDGKRTGFVRRRPGSILFIPAGCHWKGWEIGASSAAYLSITVDPTLVTEFLDRSNAGTQLSLPPDLGSEDQVLMNAARGIGAEIQDRSPLSKLLVESYVSMIFVQLLRKQQIHPRGA